MSSKKSRPPPVASRHGPIHISSPIPRSPDSALLSPSIRERENQRSGTGSPSASPSPGGGVSGGILKNGGGSGGRKGRAIAGLGFDMGRSRGGRGDAGYEEYDLSPTHAYLEDFDSYPSTPDPSHTPIPQSPSMDSPGFSATEKDPLGEFGRNQYPSNAYLAPTLHSHGGRNHSGLGVAEGGEKGRGGRKGYGGSKRTCIPTNPTKRRWLFFGVPIGLVVIAAVAVGVVVGTQHKSSSSSSSGSGSGAAGGTSSGATKNGTGKGQTTTTAFNPFITTGSGKNGTTVTTDLGVNFTYINGFGGSWAQDPYNPYHVSGRAQSWSPSLLEDWVWGQHIVRGVNLGGWLVTEPFIAPALYEQYQDSTPKAVDEYTLSQAMGADLATKMEEHYKTFITEEDFALIASAGLNYVRIALGYWAVQTEDGEPYLPGVSWTYFLKAVAWGRKYGIRILIDFHALPGSQNGWNHSGKAGTVNWMYGVMGIANAERSLEVIRSITEFISQDGIRQGVPMLGLVNEVMAKTVGKDVMAAFYYQAYELVRGITGYGAGKGPVLLMHEGFLGVAAWSGFLSGADRLALDQHPYLAFSAQSTASYAAQASTVCSWGGGTNDSSTSFGLTFGGEWSNAVNDCGYWLNGVGSTPSYSSLGADYCKTSEEYFNWSDETRQGIMSYTMANMDALQNWFFWTWKIGNSTVMGYPTSPLWHYKLGWESGWIPRDPRAAGGHCGAIGVGGNRFLGRYPASATGSLSTPTPVIAADQLASHSVWPPTSLGPNFTDTAQIALFPTYTQTGTTVVLPTVSHPANATIGSGWANVADTTGAWVKVAGCIYPDSYDANAASLVPTALCTGSSAKRRGVAMDLGARATPTPTLKR
ncbi:hypothetical protein IAR55_007158 [Kwoniella newhampshirensis]|uniref:glucan 1,3-beta-glucosidase n=1 Tax=Kwoniella newhampshirensis TaxID=1651941 RepID=A0AAW0YWD6_9TREE